MMGVLKEIFDKPVYGTRGHIDTLLAETGDTENPMQAERTPDMTEEQVENLVAEMWEKSLGVGRKDDEKPEQDDEDE